MYILLHFTKCLIKKIEQTLLAFKEKYFPGSIYDVLIRKELINFKKKL